MGRCRTAFNAYSVKFSPFLEGRIAVATAQNFGIIGNGKQHVFEVRGIVSRRCRAIRGRVRPTAVRVSSALDTQLAAPATGHSSRTHG
jgi:hypothetical protein